MKGKEQMLKYVKDDAEKNDCFLCPDEDLLDDLIEGLVENERRYGYPSCPCREASGVKTYDSDIICPCEYRDADVEEHGMCYCGLFVSKEVKEDPSRLGPIPERRPSEIIDAAEKASMGDEEGLQQSSPEKADEDIEVWRCTVCGYIAARETPPPVCPICKAKAEKFERFDGLG
ncbi:MAG: ferredoxin-thioredoxin reductase catalytic domain-containing protein [Candidatus Thermoplasmatota archaeon]